MTHVEAYKTTGTSPPVADRYAKALCEILAARDPRYAWSLMAASHEASNGALRASETKKART